MSSKADARASIYARLKSAPTFHPSSTDLFSDWTLQGGDIVTIYSDNVPYDLPIYSQHTKWAGKPKVSVQSTGGQQLPSIEELAQQKSSQKGNRYRSGVSLAEQSNEIHHAIYDESGYLHTYIDVTASSIRTEVGSAISGMAQSVIEQTATYIRTEVSNAASSISATVIEQTAEYVRTEVADVASGIAWSVVEQTMTGIIQEVGRKSTVYVQYSDPSSSYTIKDGDIWIKTPDATKWNEVGTWNSLTAYKWRDLYGGEMYVWKNNAWKLTGDKGTTVESTVRITQNENSLSIVGHSLDTLDQKIDTRFTVASDKIDSSVSTAKSQIYSTIEQTATQIRTEVVNAASGLQSSITQNADMISLVVETRSGANYIKPASIVAAINDGASSVVISADHIDLDGYVKASDLTTTWLSTKIAAISNLSVNNVTATSVKVLVGQNLSDVATQTYVSGCPYDLRITSSGNTYTLQWKRLGGSASWSDVGSFSRATSLGGVWSSGKLTVTASPQGETFERILSAGTASWSGTAATIPINATWGSSGQYSESTGWTAYIDASSKLQSKTFTSNGTKTPDSGYIGFSSVTVNVSGGGAPDITNARGGYSSKDSLANSFGVSASSMVQIFSSVTIGTVHNTYAGFKCTGGGSTKYYYFYVN